MESELNVSISEEILRSYLRSRVSTQAERLTDTFESAARSKLRLDF